MDWNNLQDFLAVARHGSLSAAAKQLAVNHSTVARRLDKLEQQLQVRLFDRLNNGYRLTTEGEALLQQALQIEQQVNQISRRFKGSESQLSGVLKVSKPSAGFINLAPLFKAFHESYPHIEIELTAGTAFSDLDRMEAEVAIRMTDNPPENLVGRQVGRYPIYIYGSRSYLQKCQPGEVPARCRWVIWQEDGSELDMEAILRSYFPEAVIAMRSSSYTEVYEAVVAGLGVSLLSPLRLPAEHELQPISPEQYQHSMGLWILFHPDLRNSARVKAFTAFVRQALTSQLEKAGPY